MPVTSYILTVESDAFVTIRRSHVVICGGDCAAALLNYYEFRYNGIMSRIVERQDNDRRFVVSDDDLLMECSNAFLKSILMDMFSRNAIIAANQKLEELGFIKIVTDIKNKYGGKPINNILLMPNNVNKALKIYASQRPTPNVGKEQRPAQDVEQRPTRDVATSHTGRNIKKERKKEVEERENTPELEKNENNPLPIHAKFEAKATDTKPMLAQTNDNKFIESDIELIPIVEKMLDDNKATFEMYYAKVGYMKTNNRDYAVAFSSQFFKDKKLCSLDESGLMKQMRNWSYIFAKVNLEIAQAQRAINMTQPPQYKTTPTPTSSKRNNNLLSLID